MFKRCSLRFCAAASSSAAVSSSTTVDRTALLKRFESWLLTDCHAAFQDNVALQPDATHSRGLVAKRPFRQGVTVLSIPMSAAAITAEKLSLQSAFVKGSFVPTFTDVRKVMMTLSVLDPVLHQQVFFALHLAAERLNPDSFYTPYFEMLPHPAIDDAAVMRLHKDVLDPMQLIEWDDHQLLFLTTAKELLSIWATRLQRGKHGKPSGEGLVQPPPLTVIYWAIRTVLARMHQLPDRGLTPPGSKLDFTAVSTLSQLDSQQNVFRRFWTAVKGLLVEQGEQAVLDYRLVPTLIPLVDLTPHLPSGNVSVEVQPRPEVGSCVELQAVTDIAEGEQVGLCWNKSQSVAFTLYRFGFLPM